MSKDFGQPQGQKRPYNSLDVESARGVDFNLPDLVWDEEGGYSLKPSPAYCTEVNTKLLDVINDHPMSQHMKQPTRKGNILDLVLTTNPNIVKECPGG